jgi:hypothetical protein
MIPIYLIQKTSLSLIRGELVREDAPPAHHEIGHLRYKTYALHVTVLWDRVVINAQTVRIPVACLDSGRRDTNANICACERH